jgi:hypothetical protein
VIKGGDDEILHITHNLYLRHVLRHAQTYLQMEKLSKAHIAQLLRVAVWLCNCKLCRMDVFRLMPPKFRNLLLSARLSTTHPIPVSEDPIRFVGHYRKPKKTSGIEEICISKPWFHELLRDPWSMAYFHLTYTVLHELVHMLCPGQPETEVIDITNALWKREDVTVRAWA